MRTVICISLGSESNIYVQYYCAIHFLMHGSESNIYVQYYCAIHFWCMVQRAIFMFNTTVQYTFDAWFREQYLCSILLCNTLLMHGSESNIYVQYYCAIHFWCMVQRAIFMFNTTVQYTFDAWFTEQYLCSILLVLYTFDAWFREQYLCSILLCNTLLMHGSESNIYVQYYCAIHFWCMVQRAIFMFNTTVQYTFDAWFREQYLCSILLCNTLLMHGSESNIYVQYYCAIHFWVKAFNEGYI